MKREKSNGKKKSNVPKIKRFAPPKFSRIWMRVTIPALLLVWIFCFVSMGVFAGYIHSNEATYFDSDAYLYQNIFNRLNSLYSSSKGEDGSPSMSYANYQKEIQFYLRYSGVATVLFDSLEPGGRLVDSSEMKMFMSIEWPNGTTDEMLSCDAKMDGAYNEFVEEWLNSEGRLGVRMQEAYVNLETWEFIPGKMYLSDFSPDLESERILYENPQPVGEGFELVTAEDVGRFWVFFPGTQRNWKTDDVRKQEWYSERVAALDHLLSLDAGKSPSLAVTTYVSPKPWIVYSMWYYVSNFFRDFQLENTIPVLLFDEEGNLTPYFICQEYRYSLLRTYGRQILWNWLGVTAACLGACTAIAYWSYSRRKNRYEQEAYRRNLTNTMAHDLKSPLMAISGYAENLKEDIHPEKKAYYMDSILECVEYMNGIVADMLELGRLEQTQIALRRETVVLEKVFDELANYYQTKMDAKSLCFSMAGTCTLEADPKLLRRALDNLLNNAIRYSPDGNAIKVILSPEQIILTNTGVSMTREMCGKAFEPFVKEDQARSDQQGSGLGLAIAKQIFDAHAMRCRIESDANSVSVIVDIPEK